MRRPDSAGSAASNTSDSAVIDILEATAKACSDWLREHAAGEAATSIERVAKSVERVKEHTEGATDAPHPEAARVKTPTFAQRAMKDIGALSDILQLRDNFEQRLDHITRGTPLASTSNPEGWSPCLAVLNAQAGGIATMTQDYLEIAAPAHDRLVSLANEFFRDEPSGSAGPNPDVVELMDALYTAISVCRAEILEIDSGPITSGSHDTIENSAFECDASLRESLFEMAETFQAKHLELHRISNESLAGSHPLQALLNDLPSVFARLSEASHELSEFSRQFVENTQQDAWSSDVDESATSGLAELYTMEAERDIHRATLHSLDR